MRAEKNRGDVQRQARGSRHRRSHASPATTFFSAPVTNCGFTLIELLVAIAIFAVVAALAYGGLATVLKAREQTNVGAERLRALQQSMLMLQRDLDQVVQRGIRDEYGDSKPALHGGPDWFEFTRGGWANPTDQVRSQLQRVAYAMHQHTLIRAHWQVLDRAQDSVPYEAQLLPQARSLKLRYLDDGDKWTDNWPPLTSGNVTTQDAPLPKAVEVTVELEQWGDVIRLFRLH